jgi:hypothetical protein
MPDSTTLLSTWEAGQATGENDRALLLHALARPDADRDELLAVPVGVRDAELADLRGALFGRPAGFRLACPHCAEQMEFDLDLVEVLAGSGASIDGSVLSEHRRVTVDDWSIRFRLPTAGDVAAAVAAGPDRARSVLLARCLIEARRAGDQVPVAQLPSAVVAAVGQAAAEADPRTDVRVQVPCPACGESVAVVFDVAQTLWSDLDRWARSTLLDVHLLAGAYGWSEPEVLALSPVRRRYYLELVADE